jgi:ribokinase
LKLHAIGFGSLNLDEIWEVPGDLLFEYGLRPGAEYVKDVNWFQDFYPKLDACSARKALAPGGSAANTIAALNRMGYSTGFYGATGKADVASMRLQELGRMEDLNIAEVSVPAGRCLALIDKSDSARDRALIILPNANDMACDNQLDGEYFLQSKWLHLTSFVSEGPLQAQIAVVEQLFGQVLISFDPGVIYCELGLSALQPILEKTEILFVTEEELKDLTRCDSNQSASELLMGLGVRTIVVKMGEKGLEAFRENASEFQAGIKPSAIRDRTGAGDVAAAGFLAGLIEKLSIRDSLKLAALAASKSIEGFGRSTYPDRDFLRNVLSGQIQG